MPTRASPARATRLNIRRALAARGGGAHVEPLLRAQLLDQQDLRDAELGADMGYDLAVDEVLLEADVSGGQASDVLC